VYLELQALAKLEQKLNAFEQGVRGLYLAPPQKQTDPNFLTGYLDLNNVKLEKNRNMRKYQLSEHSTCLMQSRSLQWSIHVGRQLDNAQRPASDMPLITTCQELVRSA